MKGQIASILKILDKPWGQMVDYVNSNPGVIDSANSLAIYAFNKNYYDPLLVKLLNCLVENNNILFHKKADYTVYQKLANCLHDLIDNKAIVVDPILKARSYSNSVYADFIFENEANKKFYEKKLLESINLFENNNALVNERFLAYINLSQFYLFKGEYEQTIAYLKKARKLLNYIYIPNYQALFWYHNSWIYVEKGEYKEAEKNIELFFVNTKQAQVSPSIYLHGVNIYASIEFRLGNYKKAFVNAKKCYKLAVKFYKTEEKDVIAENLVTMSRYYKMIKNYSEAEVYIKKAISIFEVIFGSPNLDPSQAVAHVVLGEVYNATNRYKQAKKEYIFAEKYYKGLYKNNFFKMNEVAVVLANLAILSCEIDDKKQANHYMQILIDNFPADNDNVIKAKAAFK
jgi:tetratricopeptide (TPR) repeat protein